MTAHNENGPAAPTADPLTTETGRVSMGNVAAGQIHSTEAVHAALRTRDKGHMAALSGKAHCVRLKATAQRLLEYVEALAHAHETASLDECQGLAIAISASASSIQTAARDLDDAVARELAAQRASAA